MRDTAALAHPAIGVDMAQLRSLFNAGDLKAELRNPHIEPRVSEAVRARAIPSAVLIPIVPDDAGPRVVVTRRHRSIRFAGHICFPGGKCDEGDASMVETALREAHEEIGIAPAQVEVLGCLGDYYTQAGYRITPVVGLLGAAPAFRANPREVDEILSISLKRMLEPDSYRIAWRTATRGHIAFHEGDIRIAGPTVSLMVGLYECLLQAQGLLAP